MAQFSFSATIHVPSEQPTIQAGIDAAVDGDTVLVADGTYIGNGNRDINFDGKNIVLISENGSEYAIIDCEGVARAIGLASSQDATTTIEGFTIKNGVGRGGGIYSSGSTARISNCVFAYNTGDSGGAIYCNGAGLSLVGCTFTENTASTTGGAYTDRYAMSTIDSCVFYLNSAGNVGGGLHCSNSNTVVKNCTFTANIAPNGGSGLNCNLAAYPSIQNSIFSFNYGGHAVGCEGAGTPSLSCTDIFGNTGGDWTGCIISQFGINGNISLDPWFCDPDAYDFSLDYNSPCVGAGSDGSNIGALGIGCSEPSVVTDIDIEGDIQNVISHMPEIAWGFSDPSSLPLGSTEIEVGSDQEWSVAEMWNPAPFVGPDTFVTYAGAELIDGETYYLRLRVHNSLAWSEWYEMSFRMNSVPSKPVLLSPVNGEVVESPIPSLYLQNSTDVEGDLLTYDYFIYDDSEYVYAEVSGVGEQADSTGWMVDVPLIDNMPYTWTVRANDGYEYSEWSLVEWFWVNSTEEYPTEFDLTYPPDTGWAQVHDIPTEFIWGESTDPDPLDEVYYRLMVAIDSNFSFVATYDSLTHNSCTVAALDYGTHYWWKVSAFDTKGNTTESNGVADFLTWVLGDANQDTQVNVGDAVFMINYVFKGGEAPNPRKCGDVNGDCDANIGDAVYLIAYIFNGGAEPEVGCWSPPEVK